MMKFHFTEREKKRAEWEVREEEKEKTSEVFLDRTRLTSEVLS